MPYADPVDEKAKKRRWFNAQLRDREFKEREKERKARWYQLNRERLIAKAIEQRRARA